MRNNYIFILLRIFPWEFNRYLRISQRNVSLVKFDGTFLCSLDSLFATAFIDIVHIVMKAIKRPEELRGRARLLVAHDVISLAQRHLLGEIIHFFHPYGFAGNPFSVLLDACSFAANFILTLYDLLGSTNMLHFTLSIRILSLFGELTISAFVPSGFVPVTSLLTMGSLRRLCEILVDFETVLDRIFFLSQVCFLLHV